MCEARGLTVELESDEANAVVAAVELAVMADGENLGRIGPRDCPGDHGDLGDVAMRIAAFAKLGEDLAWRTHWGFDHGRPVPDPVTVPESTWVDLLGELNKRADEVRRLPDMDPRDVFEYDKAARTVARAFAGAAAEVA